MKKTLVMVMIMLMSTSAFSSECASNIDELKTLIGNSDISVKWLEKSKNPLVLSLKNEGSLLGLKLKKDDTSWADVIGIICRKGNNYMAKVTSMKWGEAAPRIAKMTNIKEIAIELPYQSMLKVSIMIFSFEFQAIQ